MPKKFEERPEETPEEEGLILKFPSPKEEIKNPDVSIESEEQKGEEEYEGSNVIRGNFSREKSGFKRPKLTSEFYIPPEDVDRFKWNESLRKAGNEILPFLWSLKGSISKKALGDSAVAIQKFSNTELVEIILDSTEGDWNKKPAYYTALANEMMARGLNPDEIKQ
nr:hypothetical protein [uncultured archaeon]